MNKNKSFAEIKNKKPFNWYEFLNKKNYTNHEINVACNKASNWVTCACGVQCVIIPREKDGYPNDLSLRNLGSEFYGYILTIRYENRNIVLLKDNQQKALKILEKIEQRNFKLICELTIKPNND